MNIKFILSALVTAAFFSTPVQAQTCNESCLSKIANQYLTDVAKQDASKLPWGDVVRYTENNVAMMIGDGFWGAGPAIVGKGIMLTDPASGNVIYYGISSEHGQAAYHGLRLKVENREIVEVESYLGREGTPDLFAPVADHNMSNVFTTKLKAKTGTARERMIALVDGWYNSKQLNDGKVFTDIADNCTRITNGVNTSEGDYWAARVAQGCKAQFEAGVYKPVDRIRARRYPVVNEDTGVVVALAIEDHATRYLEYKSNTGVELKVEVPYPNSRGMLELFKIVDGKITRVEGVSVFLPYYIHSLWQ